MWAACSDEQSAPMLFGQRVMHAEQIKETTLPVVNKYERCYAADGREERVNVTQVEVQKRNTVHYVAGNEADVKVWPAVVSLVKKHSLRLSLNLTCRTSCLASSGGTNIGATTTSRTPPSSRTYGYSLPSAHDADVP